MQQYAMMVHKKSFIERYNNLKASCINKSKRKSTQLAKYIWELKNSSINYNLKCSMACKDHYNKESLQ